jgi:hypothetical protein
MTVTSAAAAEGRAYAAVTHPASCPGLTTRQCLQLYKARWCALRFADPTDYALLVARVSGAHAGTPPPLATPPRISLRSSGLRAVRFIYFAYVKRGRSVSISYAAACTRHARSEKVSRKRNTRCCDDCACDRKHQARHVHRADRNHHRPFAPERNKSAQGETQARCSALACHRTGVAYRRRDFRRGSPALAASCLHFSSPGRRDSASQLVITGLVPVIPLRQAQRVPKRDGRDEPGHNKIR